MKSITANTTSTESRLLVRSLKMFMKKLAPIALAFGVAFGGISAAEAADKKPNIVVIFGDDIGMWNVGAIMDHLRKLPSKGKGGLPVIRVDGRAAEVRAIKVG
jgi:hypothetical protein